MKATIGKKHDKEHIKKKTKRETNVRVVFY